MKKLTTLFLVILFHAISITSIHAKPIDTTLAKTIAKNLYFERANIKHKLSYSDIEINLAYTRQAGSTDVYYVFNITGKSKGFVIISADDAAYPVLGYSLEGNYVQENQPPAFIDWMDNYRDQIIYIKQNDLKSTSQIDSIWQKYQDVSKIDLSKNIQDVLPLLATTWDQYPDTYFGHSGNYNALCPVFPNGDISVTGCPATAMGQIMKYWNYPPHGTSIDTTGGHSYPDPANLAYQSCPATPSLGTISADFVSTNYDWANMPDSLYSGSTQNEINAVAQLLFHCGVSVNTNYSSTCLGSGISLTNFAVVANAYKTYFGYATTARYKLESDTTSMACWIQLLINELNAGRPIQYTGTGSGGGHTFVCEGYQGTDHFYFNWGWSGNCNDYFYLNNLNPHGEDYTNKQAAVIGIQPGALLELNSDITTNPNPLQQNQSAVITVDISNIGQADFNGSIWGALTDAQNQWVCNLDSGTVTLNAGTTYTVTFNATSVIATPGNYKLAIRYKPLGFNASNFNTWILAAKGNFTNPIDVQVAPAISTSTLQLYSDITVSPDPMVQYQNADITAPIYNYGSTDFNGNVSADLYTTSGQYVQNLDNGPTTLLAGYTYNITFNATSLTADAGNYYIAISCQPNGGSWAFLDQGSYTNPIPVQITCAPDQYEPNNTEGTAYLLPVTFSNDYAVVQTTGSNLHITSDVDFYKINLPTGYNYTISSRVQDSYDSNNGLYYTCDVQYAYKNGSNWSGAIDTQASDFDVINGGVVIFDVVPYFSGDLGTYLLDLSISRTCIFADIPGIPTGTTSLCINPSNTNYTTSGAANATSYLWSISPSGAGTISGTGITATVNWNNTYTGTATIAVEGNNNCGYGTISNTLTVTINPLPTIPTITQNANTLVSSSSTGNQWYNSGGAMSGQTNQSFNPPQDGLYYVIVTDANGCSAQSSSFNFVATNIETITRSNEFNLYPNPATNKLTLEFNQSLSQQNNLVKIYNIQSQLLIQQPMHKAKEVINISNLAKGMYFLKVENESGVAVRRFVKE